MRKNLNVDSLIGVPCFLCPKVNKVCSPEFCHKLDSWLGIPNPQHRALLSPIEKKKEVFVLDEETWEWKPKEMIKVA